MDDILLTLGWQPGTTAQPRAVIPRAARAVMFSRFPLPNAHKNINNTIDDKIFKLL